MSRTSPREECVAVNKATKSWGSEECFDIRHGDVEFGLFSAGFQSCFGPVFPHCAPFPTFETAMYILCHYMLEVSDLFFLKFYFDFIDDYS